jgi:phospholipase A1/A2
VRSCVRGLAVVLAIASCPAAADWLCTPRPELRQPVSRLFSALDDNYFITGIPADAKTSTNQVKFQLSFKFDLLPNEGPCGVFFGYTQRSVWKMWDWSGSSPFEDSNYNPQLFFVVGIKDVAALPVLPSARTFHFLWARIGVEHESNGFAGPSSRSWQRLFASARFGAWFAPGDIFYLTLQPKAWVPFVGGRASDGGGNPDLLDYVGYGQLTSEVGWHSTLPDRRWQDLNLEILLRKGLVGSRGTIELTLRYRPPWHFTSFSFYGQAFFGYDETLLRYNQRTTAWRFGIAFDDRFNWTTGGPGNVSWPPPPP